MTAADPVTRPASEEQLAACQRARKALRRERRRLLRLVGRLAADLARADEAPAMRRQGEALKYCLAQVPSGADRVTLQLPWAPEEDIEVPLRRDLTPAANMARIFRRARALDRARADISGRHVVAKRRLERVEGLLGQVDPQTQAGDPDSATVAALLAGLRDLGLRLVPSQSAPALSRDLQRRLGGRKRQLPVGIQRFTTERGAEVLVGRSAQANDALVTRLSRGRDAWMHVRDQRGAHVLLRAAGKTGRHHDLDLRDCAMLAAHLSGIGRDDRIDVTWSEARHVRKGKALPVGAVYVAEAKTLRVQVDGAVIDAFYARRKAGS